MALEYSMDDSDQRFAWPKGQSDYGGSWWLVADDLAHDYFDNHDGWESSWPQTLRIFSYGKQVAAFKVEMERVPEFHACEIEEQAALPDTSQPGTKRSGVDDNG